VSEQREMTDAFHNRGSQDVKDVESPDLNDGKIPILMVKSEGRRFFDPIPSESADDARKHGYIGSADTTIPGGFKIHKLRVAFQLDVGLVGWQLVWWADGVPRDIEGPKRGKWKGGAITTKEIVVPREDFVVGIEYWYEANAMYGIRFKLHHGGWTKMIGKKNSLSTLTMYLGVEQAPVEPFEADYLYAGRDEELHPGYPRRFIIGFCGIEGPIRATCMGLIVRKVKYQHIFSYNWVQDVLNSDDQALTDQAAGAERLEDILSLPSIVQGGGDVAAGESITLSSVGFPNNADVDEIDEDTLTNTDFNNFTTPNGISSIGDASAFEMDLSEVVMEDYVLPHQKLTKHDQPLTKSEEQFFDVVRMRTTEVKVAHMRSIDFAKRIFKSKFVRADPQLCKLASVRILCLLTKWLFAALSRKLIVKAKTEEEGKFLTETGIKESMRADILQRRTFAINQQIQSLESTPQPWKGKKMLGPADRAAKKAYYDKISYYRNDVIGYNEEILALKLRSVEHMVRGKALMSRIQVSKFVCANYALKVAASKHKDSLLQLMDIEQIKAALTGTDTTNMALSVADMEMIRSSLKGKANNDKYFFSLDDVVEHELSKDEPDFVPTATMKSSMISNNTQTMAPKFRETIAIKSAHWKQTKKKEYANHIYSRSMTSIPTIPLLTKTSNGQQSSRTKATISDLENVSKDGSNREREQDFVRALDLASPRSNH